MKKTTWLFVLLIISISTLSQKQVKIYFDEEWKVINEESAANYYRIITYNKDNKSGIAKDYFKSGKIQYIGKFLFTDLNAPTNDVSDGECVWYFENGMKQRVSKFVNGKEIGTRIYLNEDGQITNTLPIINGVPDEENMLQYFYSPKVYSTLKGSVVDDNHLDGEFTSYYKEGDTIIRYMKNSTINMPIWTVVKPFQKNNKSFAIFEDNFTPEEKSNAWTYFSDEKAKVDIVNNQLHISFNSYKFPRIIPLDDAPISLNDNDFSISVKISKESTAMGQGIEFGRVDNDNLFRIGLANVNGKGMIIYEKIVDGNFVEDNTIEEIYYKNGEDNELLIKKRENKIIISVNGYVAYEIENAQLLGNGIALFGAAIENHNQAYFKNFKTKIEVIKSIPTQVSVKKEGGVYTLPVELNGVLKIDFIFDSGASDVSITPDVALTLLKAGTIKETDWLQGAYYKFADGSTAKSKRFKLKSLKIGNKVITNIACSISNSLDAPMLLGQSVLGKFGKFTFDNKKQVLIFE